MFQDSVKAPFLLITLPESWETFCTAISNSAPVAGLTSANVESSLLTEEVNRKNLDSNRGSSALVFRGRSKDKKKQESRGKSRRKSRGRRVLSLWKEGTFEEGLPYTQAGKRQRESEREKIEVFSKD